MDEKGLHIYTIRRDLIYLGRYFSSIDHIHFVSNESDNAIGISLLLDLFHPFFGFLKGSLYRYTKCRTTYAYGE